MKNRYGNYVSGKSRLVHKFLNQPGDQLNVTGSYVLKSISSMMPEAPKTDTEMERSSVTGGMWGISSSSAFATRKNRNWTVQTGLTYEVDSQTADGTQPGGSFIFSSVDVTRWANQSARVVFRVVVDPLWNVGDNYRIDLVNVSGTSYSFENTGQSWETTTTNVHTTPYTSLAWTTVGTTRTRNRWYSRNETTSGLLGGASGSYALSTSFNITSVFTEPAFLTMWTRSPVIALGATPTFTYYYAATYGVALYVYLDIQ